MTTKIRKWAWLIIGILLLANSYLNFTQGQTTYAIISLVLAIGAVVFTIYQFRLGKRDTK
ncbi:MAG: hypothetical protein P9L91_04005 [Candidatus Zophobacter franzmannii]|nr:hypothetical protein [Candidatus Zophobacter franzmannii]